MRSTLSEMPAQGHVNASGVQAVELAFTQFAELRCVAPVAQVVGRDRQCEPIEAVAQGRVENRIGRRVEGVETVQPVLTGPARNERSAETVLGGINQSQAAAK